MEKYLIVDFMNYIHRGLIGMGPKDEYSLVYCFFVNLRATIEQFNPTKLMFALEGHPQHRYDLYPQYKENRIIKTGSNDEKSEKKIHTKQKIHNSAEIVLNILKNINCTTVKHPNYEADDCINTLCAMLDDEDVVVITSDSDAIQLLQKYKCKVYNPIKKQYFEASTRTPYVVEKAIRGDKTDNIKSVLKPKKADAALNDPKVLEEFLKDDEIRNQFNTNCSLIEFVLAPTDELELVIGQQDFDKVFEEFEKMDFKSFTEKQNEKAEAKWNKFTSTFKNLVI